MKREVRKQGSKEVRRKINSLLLCCFASLFLFLHSPTIVANPDLADEIHEITLPNGMKFLLYRRPGAPVFSAYIRVKVGGIDEQNGKTGVAHLLEHMAFKGTSEIGTFNYEAEHKVLDKIEEVYVQWLQAKGTAKTQLGEQLKGLLKEAEKYVLKEEFSKIYSRNGAANLNANTSQDLTTYFVGLPNTKLQLWAYLESSRLKDPVFREFYPERDVVEEERRMRVDDSPFGKLYETFINISFDSSPYRRPTIGYAADIQKLSATDLKNIYKKYYVPSNMVGAIVGDIDIVETKKILKEYFGNIPPGQAPPTPAVAEPESKQEKRTTIFFDAGPSLMIGYGKPNLPNKDDYIFDVLEEILCEGRTSRLYRRLVEQDQSVQTLDCDTSTPGSRLNNLFFVYASIANGHSYEEVLKAIDEEFQKIVSKGIPTEELAKAKKNLKAQWYYDMQSNDDLAELLSYFEAVSGSWKYILDHQKQIQSVSGQEIQRVVQTYLKPQRRRVAILKSKKKSS